MSYQQVQLIRDRLGKQPTISTILFGTSIMQTARITFILCLCLCWGAMEAMARSPSGSGRMVCWTNNDGVRECGDRVPPEYAQQESKELNQRGMVIKETERAKTEEELQQAREEAQAQAEEERLVQEQAKKDKMLLNTFFSVEEIEKSRDSKIERVQISIDHAEKRSTKMKEDLDKLTKQAADAERAGKAPAPQLLKDIESLQRQLQTNEQLLADRRLEQEELRASYEKDIERFKELKPEAAASATAAGKTSPAE